MNSSVSSYRIDRIGLTLATAIAAMLCVLALFVPVTVHAQQFPDLSGRIVDQAGLLDAATEAALTADLEAHETQTSNQIVVATIPDLDGYAISDYANRLGRHWGIGTAEEDNGVLLLVAPKEKKVRIEVGYGLEGALTDSLSSIIIQREILPAFRTNNFQKGIENGITAIQRAIAGEYVNSHSPNGKRSDAISDKIGNFIPLIFIAMVAIPEILRRTGNRKAAHSTFPAGFGGLFATLATGNLLIGLAIAVVIFIVIFLNSSGGGGSGGRRRHGGYTGTGGIGGGFSGGIGGGFGGGGGSFGGGGASGSW